MIHQLQAGKKVAVVGGGNVAMDAARTALTSWCRGTYCISEEVRKNFQQEQKKYIMQKKRESYLTF